MGGIRQIAPHLHPELKELSQQPHTKAYRQPNNYQAFEANP
jgi:hypothetical protein